MFLYNTSVSPTKRKRCFAVHSAGSITKKKKKKEVVQRMSNVPSNGRVGASSAF